MPMFWGKVPALTSEQVFPATLFLEPFGPGEGC